LDQDNFPKKVRPQRLTVQLARNVLLVAVQSATIVFKAILLLILALLNAANVKQAIMLILQQVQVVLSAQQANTVSKVLRHA
jgi:hypothetical protein